MDYIRWYARAESPKQVRFNFSTVTIILIKEGNYKKAITK